MSIKKNSVVTLHYEMFNAEDQLIDKTEQPIAYLHVAMMVFFLW